MRENDIIARIGGDEFIVILEGISDNAAPAHVAQKIIAVIDNGFDINGHDIRVGASIGIALYPDHGTDLEKLLKQADDVMYTAKRQGKNNYQFCTLPETAAPPACPSHSGPTAQVR